MEDYLFTIWRTDKATASYFVDGISDIDKSNFNGSTCINYSAVIYRLNEIIDSPITDKRRGYLRLSEDIGQSVRDSDAAEVYRLKYNEHINSIKKEMKNRRIEHFGIENYELTGSFLNKATAEFHHIRRQSTCPDLISMIWNGVIVNKDTHNVITSRNANDEYDLLDLCEEQGWNTGWFNDYQTSLKSLDMQ
ncbi:hypothetical protein [Endozoicomonas euniceicola]|uniref:Uncharacterized protein n=1 Tax=Endozoicomonas euniceicola TaxID=1234143 RepID=A0ABY6GPY3_9GAMM|nr:hypothetical protein [Endozoicomonas euniceicola]UYM14469.1 hypothetical protein NX720_16415 [Endozoicomonas euniceicola]